MRGKDTSFWVLVYVNKPEKSRTLWICRRTEIIEKTAATQTGDQEGANTENHNLLEEKPININFSKTSAKEGKTELSLMNFCKLSAHKSERENYRGT